MFKIEKKYINNWSTASTSCSCDISPWENIDLSSSIKPFYQYWLLYMYYAHAGIGVNKRLGHCLASKKQFPKISGDGKYSFVNVHSSKAHQIIFHRILLIMDGETMTLLVLLNHSSWHPSAQTMMASATGSCNTATAR